jgi:hypothetical protein
MALERFIAQHLRIAETLVGVPCERMTAMEIFLEGNRYQIAEATNVFDFIDDSNGTYAEIFTMLRAIGDKFGVDDNDDCDGKETVGCMDYEDLIERANKLMAV